MKVFICAIVAGMVALASAGTAVAEATDGQSYFSVMGSYIDDDNDRNVDDGVNGGQISFGRAFHEDWNIELLYMAGRGNGNPDISTMGIGLDLQRVFRQDAKFSPYLHGGAGYFQVDPVGASTASGEMLSAGVGFYLDLFSTNIALRGEYRYRLDTTSAIDPEEDLFSLGLQLPFGSARPKWLDSDGDGVSDGLDRCPNTPAGTAVDAYGCPLDDDGDGISRGMDNCPESPPGVKVDAQGCPLDSDMDGVADYMDKCPNTVRGAKVDANGCELDSDGDGVVDRLDECPDTEKGTPVDSKGCPVEGDYVLEGVNFESNSDRLLSGATAVLDDVIRTLKRYPKIRFEVAGHTDSDGAAAYNEGLSARRAQTVHDYLAANGIAVNRMTVRGYGESQPIADNTTAAGKAQNRRVALNVIED